MLGHQILQVDMFRWKMDSYWNKSVENEVYENVGPIIINPDNNKISSIPLISIKENNLLQWNVTYKPKKNVYSLALVSNLFPLLQNTTLHGW